MSNQPSGTDLESGRGQRRVGAETLLRGIRRYPLTSLLFFLLSISAGTAVWYFLPLPKVTGYTTFQISAQPQSLFTPVGDDKADFRLYCQAQSVLVKSRPVLDAALKALEGADRKPAILEGRADKVAWLSTNLQVDFRSSPEFMRLSLEGDDPDDVKAIIDAVKTAYMKEAVDRESYRKRTYFNQLDAVQHEYERVLEEHRKKVDNIAEGLGSANPENIALKEKFLQEQLGMAERELVQIQSEMRRAEVEAKKLGEKVDGTDKRAIADEAIREAVKADPDYQKLLARRNDIRESINETRKALTPGSRPAVLVLREDQLAEVNRELENYVERVRPEVTTRLREGIAGEGRRSLLSLQDRMAILKDLETAINGDIKKLSKKVSDSNLNQSTLESYKLKMAQTQRMSDRVSQELEQMRPELQSPPRVSVWEDPNVVAGVEGNRRLKYSLLVGGAIALAGLGLVTFLEARNRYVVTTEDAAQNLGLRLIGTVPQVPRRLIGAEANGSGQSMMWQSMLTESVDATRTMLIHSTDAPKSRLTIVIASAMPGEGKTMLACNLASSLARGGFQTLLVDGDLRRPNVHRVLGTPLAPGLCELLRGEVASTDAVRPTAIPGLSFVPAGVWDARIAQALSNDRWQALKSNLETGFDYLIIDSSPLLLVADALLMARHADGAVISVLRNVSAVDEVAEARDRLKALGVRVFGVIVNGLGGHRYRASYYPYVRARAPDSLPASS